MTTHHVTVTFSLPEALNKKLHAFVERRGLSRFVAKAIDEALQREQGALRAAYAAAREDDDREKIIGEWSALESEDWGE